MTRVDKNFFESFKIGDRLLLTFSDEDEEPKIVEIACSYEKFSLNNQITIYYNLIVGGIVLQYSDDCDEITCYYRYPFKDSIIIKNIEYYYDNAYYLK